MNYQQARQRKTDGRWDFTSMNDGVVHAIGYCCEYDAIDPSVIPISEEEQNRLRSFAHKHHTDGHDTAEQAQECYKEYLLDHRLRLDQTMSDQQQKCRICGAWTDKFATLSTTTLYVLCPEHNNRESVAQLYKAPSQIWTS